MREVCIHLHYAGPQHAIPSLYILFRFLGCRGPLYGVIDCAYCTAHSQCLLIIIIIGPNNHWVGYMDK
jgi:hypothetical protein